MPFRWLAGRPRRWGLRIALLCFAIAVTAAILAVALEPACPLAIRIVNTAAAGATKDITVEFRRLNPAARFSENDLRLQVRLAGRWSPPERIPQLADTRFLIRTNCEQVTLTVPSQTEAGRFVLDYRPGSSPRCQAYGFLCRHRVNKTFPQLGSAALKYLPAQRKVRHVEIEVLFPVAPANPSTATTRDSVGQVAALER